MSIDWTVIIGGLIIGIMGLALALFVVAIRRLRTAEQLMRRVRQELDKGGREQAEIKPYVLQLGERLSGMEKRLRHLGERMSQVESRAQSGPDYDQAIRMARNGAGPDELMRQCGLGQSEAKLVVAIHGVQK
ncbi:Flp pilus assembly protein TadB [Natronospira proteinivora]|uniref:Flp pilus assembly protein TadB n=1 Tax=Natronospira proteinivora TaxID=1807133 RepID=A0ABT1G590_9GAMM|nr:DUF2802 domain-containing protein [Natronospira proteinivora]MCP1726463.1 Flp pilus assembly protein TadB [Natronospira proteinivora]